jgi:hypothetical protein
MRTTLVARMQLVSAQLQIENTIHVLLRLFGLKIGAMHRSGGPESEDHGGALVR